MEKLLKDNLTILINKITDDSEFEIMFNNYKSDNILDLYSFTNILKYAKYRNLEDKLELEISNSLDISYNYEDISNNSYRISIEDIDNINKFINGIENRNNSIIYSLLVSKILNKEKNITIIDKVKNKNNIINIDEYDVRIRLSDEKKVNNDNLKKLNSLKDLDDKVNFRYKQRMSLKIEDNDIYSLSLDITDVKSSNNIKKVLNGTNTYEVEIDLTIKNKDKVKKEKNNIINKLIQESINVKNIIEYNYYLISNNEKKEILEHYNSLLQNKKNNIYSMNVISLQSNNIVDDIILNYSVTDKADGEHYALIVYNSKIYLISSNLDVKFIDIEVKNSDYNNTILDGELIYLKNKKFLFTGFDILYYKNKDIRNVSNLEERIKKLDDVIVNLFDSDFKIEEYNKKYEIKNLIEYHNSELDKYLEYVNKLICQKEKKYIITRKYYMFSVGISNNEIFKYLDLLWSKYTSGNLDIWAYKLDGIVLTPLNQKYTNKVSEQKYRIYKWKPPNENTIDFYFREEKDNGKVLNVFDNTDEEKLKNKPYRICNLYVGEYLDNSERPKLFREEEDLHKCHIYLKDGYLKDIEGNLIQDDTVVEFYYNRNDENKLSRWIPIRTRYDKTYMVKKFKKKYGNHTSVADSVWKSILENNNSDVMKNLANDDLFKKTLIDIKNKVNISEITKEKAIKSTYYKKQVDLAKDMRSFHNFLKSIMIYRVCSKKKVLDIGVGRGGDLMKFYHARVKLVIGLDVDSYEIESTTDGPKSRANTLKQKFPGFPPMFFGLGDGGVKFNLEDQQNKFPNMSDSDKKIIIKNFGESTSKLIDNKFDVFNCQFMIHFLFRSDDTLNNLCDNINNFLDIDGYIIITTLDGEKLHKLFKNNNGIIETYYTDDDQNKKLFFRFKANYDFKDDNINKTGLNYDSYLSWINQENEYYKEYLINNQFMIDTFSNNCNLTLIDTASFGDLYKNYETFFNNSIEYESEERTKKFFRNIKQFYSKEITHEQIFSFLNRMYIFKKN